MEGEEYMLLNGETFVQFVYEDEDTVHNLSFIENGATKRAPAVEVEEVETETPTVEDLVTGTLNEPKRRDCKVGGIQISNKAKRRACLTGFGDDLPNKRKNECAKRELTSIVNQLGKIDKQLNTKGEKSRVAINFVATFTSFKSNRVNTYKYPLDAEVKKTFLDYDTTITAVKNAVKEAVTGLAKESQSEAQETIVIASSSATDNQMTPTKTISAFTALPSPVAIKGQPVSSKNLCIKNSCTYGKKIRKHVWVKCCYQSGGQGCTYWVHAPCIGFPTLKQENVQILDGWYNCPEHTEIQMKCK